MRVWITSSLVVFSFLILSAQPPNDDCSSATLLNLTNAPACPSTTPVTNTFSYNNINATPIAPYPVFDCQSGTTSGPAAEVWFTFIATANQTTITVGGGGLTRPNIVIYRGSNCVSMQAFDCNSSNGSTSITVNTLVGSQYFVLVSGADLDDQGNFNLTFVSRNLCNSCAPPGAISIAANPPPINGTYASGQQVEICVEVNAWNGNAAGTIEWLHAVTFEFGDGWDVGSLEPIPPASCDGDGSWDWYDSWVSCNTGETFGPGFAYDSSAGVGCGGSPNDGDPGNNWGDGGGPCSNVPNGWPGPFRFCFNITVGECPPNFTGDNIGIDVSVWSDGDSGSWNQTGCNTGQEFNITSSVVCCNDDDPIVNTTDVSCAGGSDGSFEIEGNGGNDPSEVFNIYVFDDNNNIVFECLGCSGTVTTSADFPAGSYSVTAINVANNCPRSLGPIDLFEPEPIIAEIQGNPEMACPGDPTTLTGSVDSPGSVEIYQWTGPNGEFYNGDEIDVFNEGIYTLRATIDGCPVEPVTYEVEHVDFQISIIGEPEVCFEQEFQLEADGGETWTWTNLTTNQFLGDDIFVNIILTDDAVIQLEATDDNGCTATTELAITVNPLPEITIDVNGSECVGDQLILTASGIGSGGFYEWEDDIFEDNPRFVNNSQFGPGVHTFRVFGTDNNNCVGEAEVDVIIVAAPVAMLTASENDICPGESVTITASANQTISSIQWLDGVAPANQNPITITPAATTTVRATVTNAQGCQSAIVTTTINVQPAPVAPVITCGTATPTSVVFNWNAIPNTTQYEIRINGGMPFTVTGTTYTATGFSPNTNVTISVLPLSNGLCPVPAGTQTCTTQNCAAVSLSINPVQPICLTASTPPQMLGFMAGQAGGTPVWSGTGITNASTGMFDPVVAGVGSHTITLTYTIGTCPYTATSTIVVNATPTSVFTVNSPGPICSNTSTVVTYTGSASAGATYTWNFGGGMATPGTGAGPHTINWSSPGNKTITLSVTENGCTSTQTTRTVAVEAPIPAPIVSCGTSTTSSVVFNWPAVNGATGYTVNVTTGQSGTLAGTSYTVTGLQPGEAVTIQVTAQTSNSCGPVTSASVTCSALNCPVFTLGITPIADICLNPNTAVIDLMGSVSGGNGNGSVTWSGPGVAGTQFSPVAAGVGQHTITMTYTEGACSQSVTRVVNVFPTPVAAISALPDRVCVGQSTTVTFGGMAAGNATYTWNFNGGIAAPGTGAGPHTVNWATGGTKTITLTVTQNGCVSNMASTTVTVEEPMPAPVINCNSNTTSITFSWNAVTGATGYTVDVLTVPAGATTSFDEASRTFTVNGLMAGEEVEIRVNANGTNSCGSSSSTQRCQAQDCPNIVVSIAAVDPICLTANAPNITLSASPNNGGTFTWSGDGIIDAANGVFSPQAAGVGTANVGVAYVEANCTYNANLSIIVNPVPTANFVATSPVCAGSPSTVAYEGSAGAGATYTWDFGGGTATGSGSGPYQVSWPIAGMPNITLSVTENGCTSEPFVQNVQVDEPAITPLVSCTSTNDSLFFNWTVAAGIMYSVTVDDAPATALDVSLGQGGHLFTMMLPNETATITVTATPSNACPPVQTTMTCTSQDCDPVTVDIAAPGTICFSFNLPPLDLEAAIMGSSTGTLTWAGPGITDAGQGIFDPQVTGPGTFTIVATYEDGFCQYFDQIDIVVLPQPSASFTVDAEVCINSTSLVTYTGGAGAGAVFDWDFVDQIATPGTGAGPHSITWSNSATIGLIVTEQNCPSEPFSLAVTVVDSLPQPFISCDVDNTSITFSWNAVPGATGYAAAVIDAPANAVGTLDLAARTYTFTNLTPGQTVTIQVDAASDNICGGSSAQQTCTAQACTPLSFGTVGYGPFCVDAAPQVLTPVISGNPTGRFSWAGPGITNPQTGDFNPAMAGVGSVDVNLSYEEDGCLYDTTYTIVIHPLPTSEFEVTSPVCVDAPSSITFMGTAGASATYNWDFNGGNIASGTGAGPYEVSWPSSGNYTVRLSLVENGCSSPLSVQTVVVEEPLGDFEVFCQTTSTSSVTFAWTDASGATGYTVSVLSGPMGVQNGNTYTMTGLMQGQEVSISVEASGNSVCGSRTASATCVASNCQPLTASISAPQVVCAGQNVQATVNINSSSAGPFSVDYTVNGSPTTMTMTNGHIINLGVLSTSTVIVIQTITDQSNTDCIYMPNASATVQVDAPNVAGTALPIADVCAGTSVQLALADYLQNEATGGTWTSNASGFNSAAGTLNVQSINAGMYDFTYTVAQGVCPAQSVTLNLTAHPAPVADAGASQTITCNMGQVTLGSTTTPVPGITYQWSLENGQIMADDTTLPYLEVSTPGNYTLTVVNEAGCSSTDEVTVNSEQDVPVADVSIAAPTCFGDSNGAISIDNVQGGQPPYQFSLNGGQATNVPFFGNLGGDSYTLLITDANGCFSELDLTILEPTEVEVLINTSIENNGREINLGDNITLRAQYDLNLQLDTIIWRPDSIGVNNANSVTVMPSETTTYSVTIRDINGCADSDQLTVIVRKPRPVYIPNGFSPNNDDANEVFYIQAGDEVRQVKSFLVFNRWGESVFENYNFLPNDPVQGWDGKHRGQSCNAAVYVYFAEIEFIDGEVILFKGDVVLLK